MTTDHTSTSHAGARFDDHARYEPATPGTKRARLVAVMHDAGGMLVAYWRDLDTDQRFRVAFDAANGYKPRLDGPSMLEIPPGSEVLVTVRPGRVRLTPCLYLRIVKRAPERARFID